MQDPGIPGDAEAASRRRGIRGRPENQKRGTRKMPEARKLGTASEEVDGSRDGPGNLRVHFIETPETTVSGVSI
jgi:hypothetical protein